MICSTEQGNQKFIENNCRINSTGDVFSDDSESDEQFTQNDVDELFIESDDEDEKQMHRQEPSCLP